jgi:hypothetical protein
LIGGAGRAEKRGYPGPGGGEHKGVEFQQQR